MAMAGQAFKREEFQFASRIFLPMAMWCGDCATDVYLLSVVNRAMFSPSEGDDLPNRTSFPALFC
jgi:hypothetical protein